MRNCFFKVLFFAHATINHAECLSRSLTADLYDLIRKIALSAREVGTVEYTDCVTAEGVRHPSNECPEHDIKQSDGEAPVMLELWGMQSAI